MSGRLPSRGQRGFSLVEAVLALAVLALAALATISVVTTVARHNDADKQTTIAYKAAQDMMEALLSMTYSDMQAQNNVTFTVPQLAGTQQIGQVQVTALSATLSEVHVKITYKHIKIDMLTRRAQ